jgi:hypothetical protein
MSSLDHFDKSRNRGSHRGLFHSNEAFPYETIQASSQIRVIELAPGEYGSPLEATWKIVDMQRPSYYEAVSHHWGPPGSRARISLPEGHLQISSSISAALQQFRQTDVVRCLWIDSICINQADNTEKDAQVRIMRSIYHQADRTLIWLGKERKETAAAFSAIQRLARASQTIQEQYGSLGHFELALKAGLFDVTPAERSALIALLERGWFYRTWVLQEVALSPKAMLHCGGHSCDWDSLANISHTLCATVGTHALGLEQSGLAFMVAVVRPYREWDRSLWRLLQLTLDCEVSDSRDKVFALLGLAHDGHDFLHLIDYDRDPHAIYLDVFQHYFDAGRPGLLNQAGNSAWRSTRSLPSWVADWLVMDYHPNLFERGSQHDAFLLPGTSPRISADGKRLAIRGLVRDQVSYIRSSGRKTFKSAARIYLYLWRKLAVECAFYPDGTPTIDAFAQTLVLGLPPPIAPFTTSDDLLTTLHAWLKTHSLTENHAEWSATDLVLYDYYRAMTEACFNRTFFRTHAGYIGLGSFFLRPGDLIVELHNGTTPFAIRPAADGCYTLVGDTYLHGFMEGPVVTAGRKILDFALV